VSIPVYGQKNLLDMPPSSVDIKTARLHPRVTFAVNNLYNNKLQYYNGKGIYKEEDF
jgi:hypothetical protein